MAHPDPRGLHGSQRRRDFGWCFLAWYFVFGPLLIAATGFVTGLLAPGRAAFAAWLVGVTAGAVVAFLLSPNPEEHFDVAMILLPALVPALVGFPPGSWLGTGFRQSWTRTDGGRVIPRDPAPGSTGMGRPGTAADPGPRSRPARHGSPGLRPRPANPTMRP